MAFTRLLKSNKGLLLIAVLVTLFSHALTRPVNIFDRLKNKFKGATSAQSQDTNAPFIPGNSCPSEAYTKRRSGCYLSTATFTTEIKNTLTTVYMSTSPDQAPTGVLSHYLIFTVFAQLPDSDQKVPVPGVPIKFTATEEEQPVHAIDATTGSIVRQAITLDGKFKLVTNMLGRVAYSIPVEGDDAVGVQKLSYKPGYTDEWFECYADTAAFDVLASLQPDQLPSLDLPSNIDPQALASLYLETRFLAQSLGRNFIDLNSLTIPQYPGKKPTLFKRSDPDTDKDLQETKQTIKSAKGIKVIKEKGKKAIKAIVKVGQKIVEIVVKGVKAVVAVLGKIWTLAGTSLKTLLEKVKTAIAWEDVLNTQIMINEQIKALHDNLQARLESNRATFVSKVSKMQGGFNDQIDAIIAGIKGENSAQVAALQNRETETQTAVVTDLMTTNMDKAECVVQGDAGREAQVQLEALEVAMQERYPEMSKDIGSVKSQFSGVKKLGVDVVVAVLTLVKGVLSVLKELVTYSVDFAIRVAAVVFELFWVIMTFEINIPVLSSLYKFVISNGKHELTLLHLTTLTPAMVWTYGNKGIQRAKAAFSKPSIGNQGTTSTELPGDITSQIQRDQDARDASDGTLSTIPISNSNDNEQVPRVPTTQAALAKQNSVAHFDEPSSLSSRDIKSLAALRRRGWKSELAVTIAAHLMVWAVPAACIALIVMSGPLFAIPLGIFVVLYAYVLFK
ncbi:hypothetical protein HK102_012956 [Quaeritorhiza haematococci]|nr:hypothetical protein HK102_012956 [Quaeritorhiza haematococci]